MTGKNLCIILGAGASADCSMHQAPVKVAYKPPLAQELFNQRFDDILRSYPQADSLATEINNDLRVSKNLSLEALLLRAKNTKERYKRLQFLEIPLYLRQLLGQVTAKYIRPAKTTYALLINQVNEWEPDRVVVVSLNYDTIFESALTTITDRAFTKPEDYLKDPRDPSNRWSVIKPHGSVNWLREIAIDGNDADKIIRGSAGNAMRMYDRIYRKLSGLEFHKPISIYDYNSQLAYLKQNESQIFYPQLVVPIEGKYGFSCPQEHTEFLRDFLKTCNRYLIIGSSFKDKDLSDEIKQYSNKGEDVKLEVIDPEPDSGRTSELRHRIDEAFQISFHHENNSFMNYISNAMLKRFLNRN